MQVLSEPGVTRSAALPNMPQLDALRAFAVLAVMFQHFATEQRWLTYLPLARLGVQLFFVLSGFLITSILLVARGRIDSGESRRFELRQFYARRVLRIFPLYYLVVLDGAAVGIAGFRQPMFWHLGYLTNVYDAITGEWAGASAHLWSLSVEEQFYLFWPWIILLIPRRWLLMVLVAVISAGPLFRVLAVIFGWSGMAVYTLTPSALDAFGLGGLVAVMRHWEGKSGDSRRRRELMRMGLSFGLPITAISLSSLAWPGSYWWIFTISANLGLALSFAWLIDGAADGFKGRMGRLLTWRPLLYTGKISYGLYLFHFVIAFSVFKHVVALPIMRIFRPAFEHEAVNVLVLLAMTFAAATLSWFLYERPILKLKRFFPYIREERKSSPVLCTSSG